MMNVLISGETAPIKSLCSTKKYQEPAIRIAATTAPRASIVVAPRMGPSTMMARPKTTVIANWAPIA